MEMRTAVPKVLTLVRRYALGRSQSGVLAVRAGEADATLRSRS